MMPLGLEKIEAAKKNGSWNRYDNVEKRMIPDDLKQALSENETASRHFNAFCNSRKMAILYWIEEAKRPETRAKRIEETVRLATDNIQANRYQK